MMGMTPRKVRVPAEFRRRWRRALVTVSGIPLVLGTPGPAALGQSEATPPAATARSPLFDSHAPLQMRIAGDLRTLLADRDSLKATYHPLTLTYQGGDAEPVTLEIEARTRGHWRRQKRNCDFPPLMLDFPRSKVEGTLFANQNKLKLVTPCRPKTGEYEQYVLREYAVYLAYNQLTPLSFRVRRATTTYVDTRGKPDSLTTHTFLLENAEAMAARNGGTLLEARGARFADVDSLQMGLVGVFLFMIGGTDWSLPGLHNMELVAQQGEHARILFPVAYDFDWTGIVDTRYATPDPRLRLRSVRDRLYRGSCVTEAQWGAVLDTFRERKAGIYAVYENVEGLAPRYVKDTREYLDDFYEVIADPKKLARELYDQCRTM